MDESDRSDFAVGAAVALAGRIDARVEYVHAVVPPPVQWPGHDPVRSAALTAEALTGAWKRVYGRVRKAASAGTGNAARKNEGGGVAVAPAEEAMRVVPGHPAKVLIDEARRSKADLVMIGPHQKRGLIDFGSTARTLLARTEIPLWVQPRKPGALRTILAAVDLSRESLRALDWACALAGATGATVHAFHCFPDSSLFVPSGVDALGYGVPVDLARVEAEDREEFERQMESRDWGEVEHRLLHASGDPAARILEASEKADLIVMGTHGKTGLTSVVLGSVALAVLRKSEKPVVAIRVPGREFQI